LRFSPRDRHGALACIHQGRVTPRLLCSTLVIRFSFAFTVASLVASSSNSAPDFGGYSKIIQHLNVNIDIVDSSPRSGPPAAFMP
jgi:hypothetical protein